MMLKLTKCLMLTTVLIACGAGDDPDVPPAQDDAGVEIPECTPAATTADLQINEFMATNGVTITDPAGDTPEWVEIYNASSSDVSMCGWILRSQGDVDATHELAEIVVPAGGHSLIWLIGDGPQTLVEQAKIKIASEGGELSLQSPDGTEVDRITFGLQTADFSAARITDGDELWGLAWHPSPGASNVDLGLDGAFQASEPGQVPAIDGLTELVMGYDQIPAIDIRIDATGIESLRNDPRLTIPGYVTFKGREYGPVGIRLKGQNSFMPIDEKPSFRVNVDEFVHSAKFFALDDLTLNNMSGDFSMMHERLAYFIARQVGGVASRSNHAIVTLNGEPYGLYANVETVKWHMMQDWFEDGEGSLYEATDVDFQTQYLATFEHESGPDDRSLLEGLATALQNPSPDAAMAAAAQFVDMSAFFRFWATCAIIGQFDSFPYSDPGDDYFVYANPTDSKLHFIPWGMDETFYSSTFPVLQVKSILATTCLASPTCKQQIVDEIWKTLDFVETMDWAAERVRIIDQISPHMLADSNKPYTNAEVTEYHNQLRFFIQDRRFELTKMLPPPSQL